LRRRFYGDPRVNLGDVKFLGVADPADAGAKAGAEEKSGK
jgi:hypothetical protein